MKVGARRAIERALIDAAESADEVCRLGIATQSSVHVCKRARAPQVCRLRQTIEDERASIEAERALNDMMREDLADVRRDHVEIRAAAHAPERPVRVAAARGAARCRGGDGDGAHGEQPAAPCTHRHGGAI